MTRAPTRRGAAAVEFALAGTLFIVLLLALVDWGWFLYQYYAAVRSGHYAARIAAVVPTIDEGQADLATIQAEAEAAVQARITQFGVDAASIETTTALVPTAAGDEVRVTLTMTRPALVGLALVPTTSVVTSSQHFEYAWQ